MIAIALSFPSGRYHCTPWGRHVNEGAQEWPPSPWRFLRSVIATWKRKLNAVPQTEVEPILKVLAAPPEFLLPPAGAGHSRHYMPWYKKGPLDKTLVFDAFVALPRESEMKMIWPAAVLTEPQHETLALLLDHMSFLGRAEAWCKARLLDDAGAVSAQADVNSRPVSNGAPGANEDLVRVLCADPDLAFANAHTPKLVMMTGRGKTKQIIERPFYDPDWHLCAETLWLHSGRWSDPPGSVWRQYTRPKDCFKVAPARSPKRAGTPVFQIVRFALDSTVLPLVTETLPVAEDARRNLMFHFGVVTKAATGVKGRSEVFSGKNAASTRLEGHRHAYFLPTDEDGDGRLDHLTIVAAMGFGKDELKAIDRLREIKSRAREQSGHPLRVLLLGLGRADDYHPFPVRPSKAWISATPFLAPRFPKTNGTKRDAPELLSCAANFVAATLREELMRLQERRPDLQAFSLGAIRIEPLLDVHGVFRIRAREDDPLGLRPIQFKRYRQKRTDDGGNRLAGAFCITFPVSVSGPIALGHSCHFGLGLFVPL